ncbi:hypothetical protein BDAP_001776 [Binucleata daphniae]
MLLPEELFPYNYSYYVSRLDGVSELQEIYLEATILYSKHCIQLIHRSESFFILYEQQTLQAKETKKNEENNLKIETKKQKNVIEGKITCIGINTSNKPEVKQCKHNAIDASIDNIVSFFITSNALCFTILENETVYTCLSRIEDDICYMYTLFSTKDDEKQEYYTEIIKNPRMLTKDYIICEKNNISTEQESDEKTQNDKIERTDIDKFDFSANNSCDENNDDATNKNTEQSEDISAPENNFCEIINENTKHKNLKNREEDAQVENGDLKEKIKNEIEQEITKYMTNLEKKTKEYYEETRKKQENENKQKEAKHKKEDKENEVEVVNVDNETEKTDIKQNEDDVEMMNIDNDINESQQVANTTDVKNIENNTYHIKIGKIVGNTIIYNKESIQETITIENMNHLISYVSFLILKMIRESYDFVEIRSEVDFTILKNNEDFTCLFFDQVCKTDIKAIAAFKAMKQNVKKVIADYKMIHKKHAGK